MLSSDYFVDAVKDGKGRSFLEKELKIIAGWGNSKADFKTGKDSNDGKI